MTRDLVDLMLERHSDRSAFDPAQRIRDDHLRQILEAARWSPTAHNMQNFELLVVDDQEVLDRIREIRTMPSETFLRENFAQLAFSEHDLRHKKTGVLASMFPPSWLDRDGNFQKASDTIELARGSTLQHCAAIIVVLYDPRKRAPASEGDVLGFMSLGCVMQSIWLMAQSLGLGLQILSAYSADEPEQQMRAMLGFPDYLKIAFACRLGYPLETGPELLRVRRDVADFAHRNRYGQHGADNAQFYSQSMR